MYAGLFLLLGTVMLAIVYLVGSHGSAVAVSPMPRGAVPAVAAPGSLIVDPAHSFAVQQQSADRARLLEASWLVLAIATGVSALLGWIAAGRVLVPVRTI